MIFLVGAAGSGMRNLAYLLHAGGKDVAGTDLDATALQALAATRGFTVVPEAAAAPSIERAERVIYSDAVPADHPLLVHARRYGKIVQSYSEAVAWLSASRTLVAVAGTHGKSSTTAMLGCMLAEGGFDPTVLVGAAVVGWPGGGARLGQSDLFIVEADEYRDHFLDFQPAHAAITNIDWDHPDYFASLAAVESSFAAFLNVLPRGGTVVTLRSVKDVHSHLPWPARTVLAQPLPAAVSVPLPGAHMRNNAAIAVALAGELGVPRPAALSALSTFPGLGRRFELIGTLAGMHVISDYGHHPAAVAATLAAARLSFPQQKLAVLFEVHTIERLKKFRAGFKRALAGADIIVLLPVFTPAGREREPEQTLTALETLCADLGNTGTQTSLVRSFGELDHVLRALAQQYTVALAFSAGKLDQYLRTLIQER